jgi:hypothetical protein
MPLSNKKRPLEENEDFQALEQGCQIFLDSIYQNGEKYTKMPQNYQTT